MYDVKRTAAYRETFQQLVNLTRLRNGRLGIMVDQSAAASVEARLRVTRQLCRRRQPVVLEMAGPPADRPPPARPRSRVEIHGVRLDAQVEAFIHAMIEDRLVEEVGGYGKLFIFVQQGKVKGWWFVSCHR